MRLRLSNSMRLLMYVGSTINARYQLEALQDNDNNLYIYLPTHTTLYYIDIHLYREYKLN